MLLIQTMRTAKRVCKDFETKTLGEYHDLCVQSNILLLANIFEKFRNMCLKQCELDPAKISFRSWTSMAKSFKKHKGKIRSLTDIDMLLMVEDGIRGEICHSMLCYAKANNSYMKDCDKNKESSYLQY